MTKRVQFVEDVTTGGYNPKVGNTEDEYSYKANEVVEFKDDRRANRWIRRGKAVPVGFDFGDEQVDEITAIQAAIRQLDPDKDFNKDGRPDVRAIERVLDSNITPEQRDKAWQGILTS